LPELQKHFRVFVIDLLGMGKRKLSAPVRLNVVCFTTASNDNPDETLKKVLDKLNKSGKIFITPSSYKGVLCLRAAFVNWRTTEKDVLIAIQELINVV